MNKTFQLTENILREIIKDSISVWYNKYYNNSETNLDEIINYELFKKGIITEMALKKKDFIFHISSLRCQLIENWCLCAYCSLYDKNNNNFKHWKNEFIAHADNIKNCKLKDGNKEKAINKTYIDKFDLNESLMIKQIIQGKFKIENLDLKCLDSISQLCTKNILNIIKFLCDDNYNSIDYVKRLFS